MEHKTKKCILIVSELIKRIKGSSGQNRESLLVSIRKSFEMKPDEQNVLSKLRMILYRLKASVEHFQINVESNGKEEVKLKIECLKKSFSNGFFTTELAQNLSRASTLIQPEIEKPKNKRLSLEEKQMKKLRDMKFSTEDNWKVTRQAMSSKDSYLKSLGLIPNDVCATGEDIHIESYKYRKQTKSGGPSSQLKSSPKSQGKQFHFQTKIHKEAQRNTKYRKQTMSMGPPPRLNQRDPVICTV